MLLLWSTRLACAPWSRNCAKLCMLLQAARRARYSLASAVGSIAVPALLTHRVSSVPAAPTAVAAMATAASAAAEAPPAVEIKAGVVPDG
jgi:hypothetical protein